MPNLWNIDRLQPGPDRVVPGDTLPAMFWHAVAARGDRTWLRQKELGLWRSWSWNDTATAVREIAHGLMALGFEHGQTASILSNTVIEWVLADLAVLSCGGVSSGIYPTDSASQVHYLCDDSRTAVLFVEDDEQLDKALQASGRLPLLRRIVVFDMEGLADFEHPLVTSLEALRAQGRQHLAQHPQLLQQRVAAVQPDDLAILVYTSGTTGKPKGAMHLHGGLTFWLRQVNQIVGQDENDERMCFLPLCHVA
jgi:long-chain acyl-CoA synthetase